MAIQSLDPLIKKCVILLLVGHFLTEVPSILSKEWAFHDLMNEERYWFWSPWYHKKWVINKYLKNSADDVLFCIIFYVFAAVAKRYSTYLFLVLVLFFCYHVIDFFMFWWNYKTNNYLYWDLLFTVAVLIKGVFKGYRPETIARIRSLF